MWYAKTSKAIPQVLADVGVVALIVVMYFVAKMVKGLIELFAVPAQKTADAATSLSNTISDASEQVAKVPMVGKQLSQPFESVAGGVDGLVGSIEQFVTLINTTALVLAIIVFAVPLAICLWKWLPWRLGFVREASAGKKLLFSDSATEMMALRAIATAPMSELAKISKDPMGAWKAGDPAVMKALANLELGRDGLKLPTKPRK